jgi:hypothetical protein
MVLEAVIYERRADMPARFRRTLERMSGLRVPPLESIGVEA